ncbi:hypothetical protein GCWU000282_02729 [Catonella morbi ATCC 51271]|uniref:Uncharacterized protein n=2 Tax=Catonella TaxID=43996 RepID=V2Y2H5_9FIRM|nr:hypothetical protein GCWU000282_02729 [Catonella morbi ATCC 51271]
MAYGNGGKEMDLVIKHKKLSIMITALIVLAICWAVIFPTNSELIKTPSTHENVIYYSVDSNKRLKGNRFLRFALYDLECNYVQLCFSADKGDGELSAWKNVSVHVNDKVYGYTIAGVSSSWKRDYIAFLIEDVNQDDKISFSYDDQTISLDKSLLSYQR